MSLAEGSPSRGGSAYLHPYEQTDASENITFPVVGNKVSITRQNGLMSSSWFCFHKWTVTVNVMYVDVSGVKILLIWAPDLSRINSQKTYARTD